MSNYWRTVGLCGWSSGEGTDFASRSLTNWRRWRIGWRNTGSIGIASWITWRITWKNLKSNDMENRKNDTSDRELRLSRVLDAPVELVWEVFTDPEHIAQWWGPNGFKNTIDR